MKKLKETAGIIWALTALLLIIILFPGLSGLSKSFAGLPFMKINPNFTGGDMAYSKISPACTLVVHRPVFDGFFKERQSGFVQVDWRGDIPENITDTIDFDMDSSPDFEVNIDTRSNDARIMAIGRNVRDLKISTPVSYGWTIRVNLKND